MELSEFVEFINVKNVKVACQFEIETKEFRRFKKPFITGKYLSVTTWEEIIRTLEKFMIKQMKQDKNQMSEILSEDEFIADDSLRVNYKILPKEHSYVNFDKLKFAYMLNWVMTIKITRLATNACKPEIVEVRNEIAEYDPNQYETLSKVYTPSCKKQTLDNKTPPEYSPRSMNGSGSGSNKYTPTRIKSNNNNDNDHETESSKSQKTTSDHMTDLFGDSSCDEKEKIKTEDVVTMSIEDGLRSRIRKRHHLGTTPETSNESSHPKTRTHKKVKTGQSLLNTWLSSDKIPTPSKITQRNRTKPSSEKKPSSVRSKTRATVTENPLDLFDDGNMLKMENFLERSKQTEIEKNQRKIELKDYEMWNCNDLTQSDLKALVKRFVPNIKQYYDTHNVVPVHKSYNPVLITTSNVLTENQLCFVYREIESHRAECERGDKEEVLSETILPEFIINLFCLKFSLTKEQALERLKVQEERHALYHDADDLLF